MCGAGNTAIGRYSGRLDLQGEELRGRAQQLQGGVAGEAIPKGAGGLVNVEDDTKLATGWEDNTPRDPTLRAGPAEPGDYTNGPQKEGE